MMTRLYAHYARRADNKSGTLQRQRLDHGLGASDEFVDRTDKGV